MRRVCDTGNFTATASNILVTLVDQRVQPLLDKMAALFVSIAGMPVTTISPCIRTKLSELGRISFNATASSSAWTLLSMGVYDCRVLQVARDKATQSGKPQTDMLWLMEGDAVVQSLDLTRITTASVGNTTAINIYYLYIPR
jgi:hypothetical protein